MSLEQEAQALSAEAKQRMEKLPVFVRSQLQGVDRLTDFVIKLAAKVDELEGAKNG